jgi:hypothetical protein
MMPRRRRRRIQSPTPHRPGPSLGDSASVLLDVIYASPLPLEWRTILRLAALGCRSLRTSGFAAMMRSVCDYRSAAEVPAGLGQPEQVRVALTRLEQVAGAKPDSPNHQHLR